MNILVTGAKGFVGKNLVCALENIRDGKDKTTSLTSDLTIFSFDLDNLLNFFLFYCNNFLCSKWLGLTSTVY